MSYTVTFRVSDLSAFVSFLEASSRYPAWSETTRSLVAHARRLRANRRFTFEVLRRDGCSLYLIPRLFPLLLVIERGKSCDDSSRFVMGPMLCYSEYCRRTTLRPFTVSLWLEPDARTAKKYHPDGFLSWHHCPLASFRAPGYHDVRDHITSEAVLSHNAFFFFFFFSFLTSCWVQ